MQDTLFKKAIVFTVVIFFICISIFPNTIGSIKESKIVESTDESEKNDHCIIKNDDIPDIAIMGNQNYVTIMLGNGDGGFGSCKEYEVGRFTTDMVTGDFNNDGFLDLVVLNSDDNDTSVLLGDGDGGFKKHRDCKTGKYPLALTSADFNLDGFLDIAFTHYEKYHISVLFGTGNGGFRTHRRYLAGLQPWGIVSGKFNRDKFPDIAVTDLMIPTVHVLYNRIFGRFGLPRIYLAGEMPIDFALADFNMDGFLDLAVSIFSGLYHDFTILFNDGWGRFDDYQLIKAGGQSSCGIVSGDFNLDGFPDIAYTSVEDNSFNVLLNVGNGSFENYQNYPVGETPYEIASADFNMDGFLDLIVGNSEDKDITVYLGDDDGNFVKYQDIPVNLHPGVIVVGNFNSRRTPDAPEITGKRVGDTGEDYVYTFVTRDPCELDVFYYIEWGDNNTEKWIGPYKSGEEIQVNHTWSHLGRYTIKARARNTDEYIGPWGKFIVILRHEYHSSHTKLQSSILDKILHETRFKFDQHPALEPYDI